MDLATEVFLTSAEQERFTLFSIIKSYLERVYIFKNQDQPLRDTFERDYTAVNLREIAKITGKTYGSVYNTYLQIIEDFKNIFVEDDPKESEIFNYEADLYRFYLMTNSYSYKFIKISLKDEHTSLDEFLKQNDISKATAMRHFKPLRQHLKRYGVRMVYDQIGFTGDEVLIRLAVTNLLWIGTNGITWPFILINHDTVDRLFKQIMRDFGFDETNHATSELFRYYVAVALERILGGHLVEDNETLRLLRFPFPSTIKRFLDETDNDLLKDHPPLVELAESASLYLILNGLPFKYESIQPIDFLLKSIKHYNSNIYDFVDDFINLLPPELLDQFNMSILEKKQFKLNLAQVVIGVITFKELYQVVIDDFFGNESFYAIDEQKNLKEIVDQSFDQLVRDKNEFELDKLNVVKYGFYQILRRMSVFVKFNTTVKVAINAPVNTAAYDDMYNFLQSIRFVELQKFMDIDETTDVIATTISRREEFQPKAPNAIITHVDDPLTDVTFGLLTILIFRTWRHKLTGQGPDSKNL